jgi:Mn-dependent DtxR family transcriptional regulator
MRNDDFYTFNGYIKKDDNLLTASMEDYVEMIYRLSAEKGFTRINDLSTALNVQPPSATKMVQRLAELKLANYEKYGYIELTELGKKIGEELLNRHNVIEEFLGLLGVSTSILEETEKIEHSINKETLRCIHIFLDFVKDNPDIRDKYKIYRSTKL